jgi:dienelactone hydrolase
MAEVLLFHHAQGLTTGVLALSDDLRAAGHTVHTPDLYAGRTYATLEDGVAHAKELGFEAITEQGLRAADGLPAGLVYAGISLGVGPAQKLAQTRPGARGALLMCAGFEPAEYGDGWPRDVPVQVHGKDADPEFANEWDLPAARSLVDEAAEGELFLYPGEQHLFMDRSLPAYDPVATRALVQRMLAFLGRTRPNAG